MGGSLELGGCIPGTHQGHRGSGTGWESLALGGGVPGGSLAQGGGSLELGGWGVPLGGLWHRVGGPWKQMERVSGTSLKVGGGFQANVGGL